jgi:hypothetical protein
MISHVIVDIIKTDKFPALWAGHLYHGVPPIRLKTPIQNHMTENMDTAAIASNIGWWVSFFIFKSSPFLFINGDNNIVKP